VKHALEVDDASKGQRLDLFVGQRLSLSRAKLKALFEAGAVRVNGRLGRKGHPVAAGQSVEVELPEADDGQPVADDTMALTILYADDALIAVNKTAGVPAHPLKPGERGTVANALLASWPELAQVSDDPREAGLCHRLDVETSGVLLAAKHREAWLAMRAAFSGGAETVKKTYLALVWGPLADEGEIDVPLGQHGDHVRPHVDGHEGREARTGFTVLGRHGAYSLVQVRLFTGVMHQIRAHLAGVGAPIVGDTLYGGKPLEGLRRFFLHASELTVKHPTGGHEVTVAAPLPEDLLTALDRPEVHLRAALPEGR
jgi:23S rRNA pseudouridine1911/1915/1917 synthase